MTTNAATIKDTVANLLSAAGVTFSVQSAGETVRDGWKCDAWRVTLGTMTTDFYTGTGLRKAASPWKGANPRPVPPVAADVLHSLLLDASASAATGATGRGAWNLVSALRSPVPV